MPLGSALQAEGFAPLRAEWLAHAARLGEPIRAAPGRHPRGVFETIDPAGNLILRTGHGPCHPRRRGVLLT
jgi:BirA family transcriptional regulator, biotin operon repressor / biotin---[acetyl-CoA-carboxylase] ligase